MAERLTLSAFTSQGFARCTSDGVFNATIWDVVVCPKWQGCGLGKAMVERLTQKLIQLDIQNVSLYAEPAVVGLYQKCGFEGTCCVSPNPSPTVCPYSYQKGSLPLLPLLIVHA